MSTLVASKRQVASDDFRDAFSRIAMPVAVVATMFCEAAAATTVSSFCSLSADPPLVAVALDRGSNTLEAIHGTGRFAINVLSVDQEDIARGCATKATGKLDGVSWELAEQLPRVSGVAVWLACELDASHPGGDHELLVGLVVDSAVDVHRPLLYHDRAFAGPTTFGAARLRS